MNEIRGFVNIGAPVNGEINFNDGFPNIITGSGGSNSSLADDAQLQYKNTNIKSYTYTELTNINQNQSTLGQDIATFFKSTDVKTFLLNAINTADNQTYTKLTGFDTNFDTRWNIMKPEIHNIVTTYGTNVQENLRIVFQFVYSSSNQGIVNFPQLVAYKFKLTV